MVNCSTPSSILGSKLRLILKLITTLVTLIIDGPFGVVGLSRLETIKINDLALAW